MKTVPECGPKQTVMCCENPKLVNCKVLVVKTVPECGNKQDVMCYENPKQANCTNLWTRKCPNELNDVRK